MPRDAPDLSRFNIVDCLRHFGETQPDHPAMEDGSHVISYAELNRRTDEAAVNLGAAGVSPGDVVTIVLADGIEHLIVICGLARYGAVIFALSLALSRREILEGMAEADSRTLITEAPNLALPDIQVLGKADISAPNGQSFGVPGARGDQPYVLVQSSGTTGKPKSFFLSHAKAWHRNKHDIEHLGFDREDRFVCLAHMCFQVCRSFFLCLLSSGATIVLTQHRAPAALVDFVDQKNISYMKLQPINLNALLDHAGADGVLFPKLRAMSCGTAPITPQQRLLARERVAENFIEYFGTNEAGIVAYSTPADQDRYPDSVGLVIDQVEVEIVDNDRKVQPPGTAGLVRFRCPGMIDGYAGNPEMTARHFRDGWYFPGDVASVNEDGYMFFLGRADDIINNAGVKFYPIEVEKVLLAHPGIIEAAVFPLPHDRVGQYAGAAVVAGENVSHDELMKFCAARLAEYKLPNAMVFMKALPKNAMGKVLKRNLATAIQARLQARSERNSDGDTGLEN